MRALSSSLRTALDSGVTTLCWCWRIERADGVVLGLTEHDQDLLVEGVTYRAGSADFAGSAETATGFRADTTAMAGVLRSDLITDAALLSGTYDNALVDVLRVDWRDPTSVVHVWRGRVGEVRRDEAGFTMELRGIVSDLDRPVGRVIQRRCDAVLGDARCGVDLTAPHYLGSGAVTAVIGPGVIEVNGVDGFAHGWFDHGLMTWTSGALSGVRVQIARHEVASGAVFLHLRVDPAVTPVIGDAFTAQAGCDKRWATCQGKFSNTENFRGFPMIPGDDWLIAGPRAGEVHDGSSRWTDRDG